MRLRLLSIHVLILVVVCIPTHVTAQERLILCGIEDSKNHEIATAILKKAYAGIGIEMDAIELPAKRSLIMSNSGDFDGEVQRIDGMGRLYPNLMKVPEPIIYLESSVFVKKPGVRIDKWSDLAGYLIGIPRGIVYLDRHTKGMNRVFVNSNSQLFRLLELERVDVVVISSNYGKAYLEQNDYPQIRMLEPPILKIPLFHYLHQKHRSLIPKIARSIREMRNKGEIETMVYPAAQQQ